MPRGAYGFRIDYDDPAERLDDLLEVGESARPVTVSWRHASSCVDVEEIDDHRVIWGFSGANQYHIERDPASIRFDLPYVPARGALVHPLLTVGISILARWRGDVTLHGGAFETLGGGWAVMGARRAGKSTLLASLGSSGNTILADDLLALSDGILWAGPRCVDLRPDVAERFQDARYLGVIGGRPRYRLSVPNGVHRVPLKGLFLLEWHERPSIDVERLTAGERLRLLYQQEYVSLLGWPDPKKLVPLLGLPAWRVKRPDVWSATQDTAGRILSLIDNRQRAGDAGPPSVAISRDGRP